MYRVLTLLVLVSMASSAAAAPAQNSFDEVAKQATSARSGDRATEAIGLYREALRMRPSWDEGWLWLGTLLYDQNRYPEAQAAFGRFVTIKPQAGPVWAMKGLCEYESGDYAQATKDLQTWGRGDSHGHGDLTEVAAFHWAMLLTLQGEFVRALYILADRAEHAGESPLLVEAMGLASLRMANIPEDYPPEFRERVWLAGKSSFYASMHDYSRSEEYSHRLLAKYGQQPEVHYLEGTHLLFELKPELAAQEFRKELEISPQHTPAMLELARIDIDAGNQTEALSLAKHAAEIEPANPDSHNILGRALLATGQASEGSKELETAERLDPNNSQIHFHLATAYRQLGRKEDADREMATYLALKKKSQDLDQAAKSPNAERPLEPPE
jgi:tetratricopeptide (TPR) repeat protein